MANPSLELRELFHLCFLRHLCARLAGRAYAVKGGACLRFFHRSVRYSEDMDLDISPQVQVETLQNAVDSILRGRSFLASLTPFGVGRLGITAPKQTETTQRWKIALHRVGGVSLPTKVEFSRRRKEIPFCRGVPDPILLEQYRMAPFAAQHYDALQMAAQKILALAAPARHAARDLFDLHHLLFRAGVEPRTLKRAIEEGSLQEALRRIDRFTWGDFKEQVVPFLPEELLGLYEGSASFEGLRDEVRRTLTGEPP